MTAVPREVWAVGEVYEAYVGRWSRLVAPDVLDWLAVPAGARWLDVGCGTGALSTAILQQSAPELLLGVDSSAPFIEHAHAHAAIGDGRARFRVGDAQALPVGAGEFDAVVAGLVINFVPDATRATAEMARAARRGGTVAAYVWDYAGDMQMMRRFWDAAVALDPGAAEKDQGRRFPLCRPEALVALFTAAGLGNVESRAIDVPTTFKDFDDYWTPFLSGQGPAPSYCTSLPEDRRAALRERVRRSLPVRQDGRIPLTARAWAVRGTP